MSMIPFLYVGIGLLAGVCSGLFGIGGGIIIVPLLVFLAGVPQHKAVGTSLVALLLPVGILAVCGVAGADTTVLQAVADNTLYEDALGETSNGLGEYVFTGDTGSFGVRRTVLRFDLAGGIPAGATISSG